MVAPEGMSSWELTIVPEGMLLVVAMAISGLVMTNGLVACCSFGARFFFKTAVERESHINTDRQKKRTKSSENNNQ